MKYFRLILCVLLTTLLMACNTQTLVQGVVDFKGAGKYWEAKYTYDSELYNEKHINWIEIVYKGDEKNFNLNNIDIEIRGRDGVLTGNLGEMETKVNNNAIVFLVGTINSETYKEDKYQLRINFNGKRDVLELRS